jgi:hypothetical protein
MQVTEYIHRYGFRRWYERQLIESHAYLALAFVALILCGGVKCGITAARAISSCCWLPRRAAC